MKFDGSKMGKDDGLRPIFERFPNAHRFTLEVPSVRLPAATDKMHLPCLRRLRFVNCSHFELAAFLGLFPKVVHSDGMAMFEKLEVEGCPRLRRHALYSLLTDQKVNWKL